MSAATAALPKPRLRGWLHAAMVPLAVVAGLYLLLSTPSDTGRWSVGVFAFFLVGLYATSSIYHVPRWNARVRYVLSRADGAMIQLFIAGTFTPVAYHALSGAWRFWSLVVAWAVAVVGAVIAASPIEAPRWLAALGYVAFGWLAVLPISQLIVALPWQGTGLIVLGGLLYTVGAIVYAKRWPDPFPTWFGFHEVFHLFVIAGSTAHYLAIWRYVLPTG
jgi:hemolysin III